MVTEHMSISMQMSKKEPRRSGPKVEEGKFAIDKG